jgi:hypothetical protein
MLFVPLCASAADGLLTADTYIDAANQNANFGTQASMIAGSGQTGLVQFSLSTLPTGLSASSVAKATLLLYVNRVSTAGNISIAILNGTFPETGVNYANGSVLIGATFAGPFALGASQVGTYLAVDVTSQVQSSLISGNVGFALVRDATLLAQFDTKENTTTSHPAQLSVVLLSSGGGGTAATVSAGTTSTGAPGSSASVTNSGTSSAAVFNFTIPRGDTGPTGPPGPSQWTTNGSNISYNSGNVSIGTSAGSGTAVPGVSLYNNGDFVSQGPKVDVRTFGALGNGVHDDTTAIQAAINSVDKNQGHVGGEVYFPRGTYIVSSPIILGNYVSLVGDGWTSQIELANNANVNMFQNPANAGIGWFVIRDLNLYGNDINNASGTAIKITKNGFQTSDIYFEKLLINHFKGDGLYIETGWQYHVNSCILEFFGGNIMHFKPTVGPAGGIYDLRRIFINNNGLFEAGPNSDGIYFEAGNGITLSGIKMTGNEIGNQSIPRNVIHLKSVSNFVITGNIIGGGSRALSNTYDGIMVEDDGAFGSEYGVISGNTFTNSDPPGPGAERYGVSVWGLSHDITIGDNQFANIVSQNVFLQNGVANVALGVTQNAANTWTAVQTFGASSNFPGSGIWNSAGSVGIGTATPAATLEVNGTAKFDGLVTFAPGQTFPGTLSPMVLEEVQKIHAQNVARQEQNTSQQEKIRALEERLSRLEKLLEQN